MVTDSSKFNNRFLTNKFFKHFCVFEQKTRSKARKTVDVFAFLLLSAIQQYKTRP